MADIIRVNKSALSGILDFVPGSRQFVHSPIVRRSVSRLLRVLPIRRRLPGSGILYEIRDLENIYSAEEIFKRECYKEAFRKPVDTLIDLGANCGYFSCYAAHRARGGQIRGLLVEPNDLLIPLIRRHLEINELRDVRVMHGLVGRKDRSMEFGDLVLSEAHTSSSQTGVHPHAEWKGFGRKVRVPFVDVADLWKSAFGNARVNLLKIDVEGSEEDFVFEEPSILPICDRLVMELHKWQVDRIRIIERLKACGLLQEAILEQDDLFEVILFGRR